MEKKFSTEDEAEARETRPLDDTIAGEAVIPELDEEEVRKRLGGTGTTRTSEGGAIRPPEQGARNREDEKEQNADDLMQDEDDTDGNV